MKYKVKIYILEHIKLGLCKAKFKYHFFKDDGIRKLGGPYHDYHRSNGPAVEFYISASGWHHKEWWIDGIYITCGDDKPSEGMIKTRIQAIIKMNAEFYI